MLVMQINSEFSTVDKEVLRRDFASRAYYTALLHCINTLPSINTEIEGSHHKVISSLGKETKFTMLSLKRLRKEADYNMEPFPKEMKIKNVNTPLLRVKAIIDDVLSRDESSLKI